MLVEKIIYINKLCLRYSKLNKFNFVNKAFYTCFSDYTKSKELKSKTKMDGVDAPEITIDKEPFTLVTEGLANVDFPSTLDVFYNPVQEFNRDLRYV